MVGFMVYGLGSASQKRSGVLTIYATATHRDLLLTGYAHVQTQFFCFVFYKRYIFLL